MKEKINERKVNVMVNIENEDCFNQMIPCHYCGYMLNLTKIENKDNEIIYIYECCNCNNRLILTYKPFIKTVYRLESEKWVMR